MGDVENVDGGEMGMEMEMKMREIEEKFWVPTERLMQVAEDIESMMRKGLEDEDSSFIKMLVSYVDSLPTGHEEGLYYALDLGGTNLRVMQVKLHGDRTIELKSDSHPVPPERKVGKMDELFGYIAEKVSNFIESQKDSCGSLYQSDQKSELGFTFSFPVHQTRINSGTLLNWTKDFDIQEAICKDMVEELTKALKKHGLQMNVTALNQELLTSTYNTAHDTVGTLAGGRFYDNNVVAAVILGTGLNAAYVEKAENILKPYGPPPKSGQMVINTEWGNFFSPSLPLTEFDHELDNDSSNPHKQILEKMFSGRYLGEIVRRVLLNLAEDAALFGDTVPSKLQEHFILGTNNVSDMHSDKSEELDEVANILNNVLEVKDISLEKKKMIVRVCEMVAKRGARLAAAAILAILKRLGKDTESEEETIVAVDGALYAKYQQFKSCVENTLKKELLDEKVSEKVILKQYKDASGIGAALVAASHSIH